MDARATRSPVAALEDQDSGPCYIAPDCAGQNFYALDRGLRDLLPLYLTPEDFRHLEPHFDRLGGLAGGRLDELARLADKHPPVLNPRDRFGRDEGWIDYALARSAWIARCRRSPNTRCNICSCRPNSA